MRILLIKLRHIGDALLLTPTVAAVRRAHPQAQIWVLVRKGCEGILAGCPEIDHVVISAAPAAKERSLRGIWEDIQLIRKLRRERFDLAIELSDSERGKWVAFLSGARKRIAEIGPKPPKRFWRRLFSWLEIPTAERKQMHRAVKDFVLTRHGIELPGEAGPLRFDRSRCLPCPDLALQPQFAVIHPGTRWQRKRWPVDRWVALGQHLQSRGLQVVISAGPDAEEVQQASDLVRLLGKDTLSTGGKTNWAQLAWLLYNARLFVGVDTAAMHLSAACQCPTVALFGPSRGPYWRPWKVSHQLVQPSDEARAALNSLSDEEQQKALMSSITLDQVIEASDALIGAAEAARV